MSVQWSLALNVLKRHWIATCFFQVVVVNQAGVQKDCEYGSAGQEQSLNKPMAMFRVDEGHFLVVDYCQHRIHLLTSNLQFVRHLICGQGPNDPDVAFPRNACLDGGLLYVGTESGTISIYRVQTGGSTVAQPNGAVDVNENENENGWLIVDANQN